MDEYRENVKKIQNAVNQDAAFIPPNPYLAQRVLAAAHQEGEPVVKRKISFALIMVLLLLLAGCTALAIGLNHYFDSFASLEDQYGEYEQWPTDAKIALVESMEASGVLSNDEIILWTASEDREISADKVLASHFQGMAYMDMYNVMTRELGPIENWRDEDRALYTTLLEKYGQQTADWPAYQIPASGDLKRTEAVERAREVALALFTVSSKSLDAMPADAVFAIDNWNQVGVPMDEPYWQVSLGYGLAYRVSLTRNGALLGIEGPQTKYYPFGSHVASQFVTAIPGEYDATQEKAIQESRNALTEIMNVSFADANHMDATASFGYSSWYCNGKEPVWLITWSSEGKILWNVLLGYDGSFIDAEPNGKLFDRVKRSYQSLGDLWRERCGELGMTEDFMNANGDYYYRWTLEEKAAFSKMWIPIVEAYEASHPYCHEEGSGIWEWTRHVNGLPDDQAIKQDQACRIAIAAIKTQFGDKLLPNDLSTFYFVTDPKQPEWRFASATRFVIIDAYSGEVKSVDSYHPSTGETQTISNFLAK